MSILYGDFKELIKDSFIKDNDKSDTIDNIRQILEDTNWSKEDIYKEVWQHFLTFLRNEGTDLDNNGLPITKNLWTQENKSLFEYLNEQIDLPDSLYTTLRGILSNSISSDTENTSTTSTFWNESVSNLIDYYLRNLTPRGIDLGNGKTITWQITSDDQTTTYSANLKQIRNSDAGKDFNDKYVNPTNNTTGESYKSVRGSDFILKDAQDSQNLKYTNPAGVPNAMRLLMPDYQRQVKIEDLNRNFWVISQCIAGISAYLFEDNSPMNNVIERVINEIVQLWENLLYLWAVFAISMSDKKEYTDVHCEIVPLSISKDYNFRKYDNFDDYEGIYDNENKVDLGALENLILTNLKYLEDTYPESNLCIVPFMRMGNYEHNYYNEEWYPGVAIFDRNKKEQGDPNDGWVFNYFKTTYAPNIRTVSSIRYGLKLSTNYASPINDNTTIIYNFLLNAWSITKSKNGVMKAHYPAYNVPEYEEWDNDTYYAIGRCLPSSFTAQYNIGDQQNAEGVEFGGITFKLEDGIGQGLRQWAKNMSTEEYDSHSSLEQSIIQDLKNNSKEIFNISISFNSQYEEEILQGSRGMYVNPNSGAIGYKWNLTKITPFGYYMGELMSDIKQSKKKYPEVVPYLVQGRPLIQDIGSFTISSSIGGSPISRRIKTSDMHTTNEIFSPSNTEVNMASLDGQDLSKWIEKQSSQNNSDFTLYILNHIYGVKANSDDNRRYVPSYWDWNGTTWNEYNSDSNEPNHCIRKDDPVLIYDNNNNQKIYDGKAGDNGALSYQTGSDIKNSRGYYYSLYQGNLGICAILFNPFNQRYYRLPTYLQYDRGDMSPTLQHSPLYHYTTPITTENRIPIEAFTKNKSYSRYSHIASSIQTLNNNNSYDTKPYFTQEKYRLTQVVLFDKSKEIRDNNWGLQYTDVTCNYDCVLDSSGIRNFYYSGASGYTEDVLGFKPIGINRDNYATLEQSNRADSFILFNMLKKDIVKCYFENDHNKFEAPFYQISFKDCSNSDYINEFNGWRIFANHADTYNQLIDPASFYNEMPESLLKTMLQEYLGYSAISFKMMYEMGYAGAWNTFISHCYVTSISTFLFFPDGTSISRRKNTQNPDGHNSLNIDWEYDGINSSLNIGDYLPGYMYNPDNSLAQNWSALYNEWKQTSELYYFVPSEIKSMKGLSQDGTIVKNLNDFLKETGRNFLDFVTYPNNGRVDTNDS